MHEMVPFPCYNCGLLVGKLTAITIHHRYVHAYTMLLHSITGCTPSQSLRETLERETFTIHIHNNVEDLMLHILLADDHSLPDLLIACYLSSASSRIFPQLSNDERKSLISTQRTGVG